MNPHHIKIKIGIHEFEAAGDQESVDRRYDLFLKLLDTPAFNISVPSPTVVFTPPSSPAAQKEHPDQPGLDDSILQRIFIKKGDALSMAILPKTKQQDADTLLLLVYGFEKLLGAQHTGAVKLMAAAKQSGLQLDRVDRCLLQHTQFVTTGGARRGKRYSLNNQGKIYAEKIISEML